MYGLKGRIKRLICEMETLLDERTIKIPDIQIRVGRLQFPCDVTAVTDGFEPYTCGEVWSGKDYDDYALFRFDVDVPDFDRNRDCYLNITTNKSGGHNMVRPQMLLLADNKVVQGLDTNHEYVCITEYAEKGRVRFFVYAFSGLAKKTPYGSVIDMDTSDGVRLFADLKIRKKELTDFYYNIKIPYDHLQFFDENSFEYQKILNSINDALSLVDFRTPHSEEFYESIEDANEYVEYALYDEVWGGNGKATLIGHTHIDLAWLWRYEHTIDKAVRSFATEVKLMREYPCHKFMSSQAQLYEYVKQQTPELYDEIKVLADEGRWEAEGAMWVEPDMNLVSGESVVLQILHGKKFFKEDFGTECKVLWLPDVFGYNAALPQILKKAGIDYFMTSKLATNEKNRFPYDTFMWKGIDGSRILAHCTSYLEGAYNPNIEKGEILTGFRAYQQKDINDDILVPFGFADGGGGVTAAQLECVKRVQKGIPGVPEAKIGTVGEYFAKLEERVSGNKRLPEWSGEIYYEKHRGTYTSMARMKKKNRRCEFLLSNAQWLWMLADSFGKTEFPKSDFDKALKNMLLNQFHDVLPGTSIREVYDDADALYDEAFVLGRNICRKAIEAIVKEDSENEMMVFNPFSETVCGYVKYNGEYRYVENVPAKGYKTVSKEKDKPDVPVTVSGNVIENQYYILRISDEGDIESLYDKRAARECFIPGKMANRLRVFEDKSDISIWGDAENNEDNWNLEAYYSEKEFCLPKPEKVFVSEQNEEYAIVRTERTYMNSRIVQDTVVYARSPRIDFKTDIDWKEHSQVLKAEFPVDVNTTRATYEIQFGYIERPTVFNTTWDEVKFEVCAHKWADVSESGYGMALMNDCKYGYSANGSVLSITLLRCGNSPNPEADKEKHSFVYSILPHMGDIKQGGVVEEAYLLNNSLFAVDGKTVKAGIPKEFSLFECKGAVLDTIKPAENGDGWVLRLYEPYNSTQNVSLVCGKKPKKAVFVDLMENNVDDKHLDITDEGMSLRIKPFEIVTIKVWL